MPYKEGKKWRGKVTFKGLRYTSLHRIKKDAVAWEVKKKRELKGQEKALLKGPDLLSFCSKYLIYAERYSKKTYDEKKSLTKRILKEWGTETPVESISVEMVQSYLDFQAKLRSANASNKDRKNLMAIFNWGKRFLNFRTNPVNRTDRLPHDRKPQYTPPTENVLRLLSVATRKERVFLHTYVYTGARRSEIYRWTWIEDVNFEKRVYRLGTRKTKDGSMHYEWFPMPDELFDELWWWWNNRTIKDSPYVFTDDQPGPHYGKRYTERRRFMRGLCKRAGIKPFGFHALRRFFASRLADRGKSTNTIRRMLRHKNVSTTERYIQNINDDLHGVTNGILEEKRHESEARKNGESP